MKTQRQITCFSRPQASGLDYVQKVKRETRVQEVSKRAARWPLSRDRVTARDAAEFSPQPLAVQSREDKAPYLFHRRQGQEMLPVPCCMMGPHHDGRARRRHSRTTLFTQNNDSAYRVFIDRYDSLRARSRTTHDEYESLIHVAATPIDTVR